MAKKTKSPAAKPAASPETTEAGPTSPSTSTTTAGPASAPSQPFVGRWNELVSTTNWEKGKIICDWREALESKNAPPADYSDESWARLVGGVSPQHVGRLRRVYAQFGEVFDQYPGIFWSHFQVAMDWDDAEMWLEGSVQNAWSVSQMRAARWEAHGAPEELKPRDEDIILGVFDGDEAALASAQPVSMRSATVRPVGDAEKSAAGKGAGKSGGAAASKASGSAKRSRAAGREEAEADNAGGRTEKRGERRRPFADLPPLPDDVAEAFEQFKLAIVRHKADKWRKISCDDILASLDALKELALLPAE